MPRIPFCLASLLVALVALHAFPACAGAGPAEARRHVNAVARVIEDRYFDPERGARIAAELRLEAERGDFDAIRDKHELATALTARLKPLDRHFSVAWSPPPAGPATASRDAPQGAAQEGRDRRQNYGIRRVELLPGNIGYLDLRQFAHFEFGDPAAPPRRAIDAALQLVTGADALVIDLRGNGGGSPSMVGYLASAFLPAGADVFNTFRSREGEAGEAPADWHAAPRTALPLYLLTSARTGSAAESFAYTLKNAGRALMVGEPTAGAANPGGRFDAGDGFRVFVSTGTPVSPVTGGNWEGMGVQPDVTVAPADALRTARILALEELLETGLPPIAGVEVRWALEALRAESAAPATVPLEDYAGRYGAIGIESRERRLFLRNGRRPPVPLQPLGSDLFASADDPSLRIRFDRDARGRVAVLETLRPDGEVGRFRREE